MSAQGLRTREFFSQGGALVSPRGGRLARRLAALGLASLVSVLPAPQDHYFGPATGLQEASGMTGAAAEPPAGLAIVQAAAALPPMAAAAHAAADRAAAAMAESFAAATQTHEYGDFAVPAWLAHELVRAAEDTGFPASTLMAIAEQESSFNVEARPPRGSAYGPMQFLEQTWLEAVRDHGGEFGLERQAELVKQRTSGGRARLYLEDGEEERRLLDLRSDPYLSAALAARRLQDAADRLEARTGRRLEGDELYLPHFLGTAGAGRLIAEAAARPGRAASAVFPRAASFNPSLFRRGGRQITVSQFEERAIGVIAARSGKYRGVERRFGPRSFMARLRHEARREARAEMHAGLRR